MCVLQVAAKEDLAGALLDTRKDMADWRHKYEQLERDYLAQVDEAERLGEVNATLEKQAKSGLPAAASMNANTGHDGTTA